jgi:hypothetical protein
MGSIKLPTKECHVWKVVAHSKSNKADPTDIKRSSERGLQAEGETNCTTNSRQSEPLMRNGSKAMRKVTAFGLAQAEQARKMYQIKRAQHVNRKTCFDLIKRSHQQFAHQILIPTNQSTQRVYHPNSLAQRASSMQEKSDRKTHPLKHQPFVRIASITSRPNGRFVRKPKNSSDKIRNQGVTIFDLLGEM